MNLEKTYLNALELVGRPRRVLKPVYPQAWRNEDQPVCMLVLTGGWIFDFGDWPAFALMLPRGTHILGYTQPGSVFSKAAGLPKIFEGSQCLLEVDSSVRVAKDYSTNGTVILPRAATGASSPVRLSAEIRSEWDRPCPKQIAPLDLLLTQYAELVLVDFSNSSA